MTNGAATRAQGLSGLTSHAIPPATMTTARLPVEKLCSLTIPDTCLRALGTTLEMTSARIPTGQYRRTQWIT